MYIIMPNKSNNEHDDMLSKDKLSVVKRRAPFK
jgi:hypothetical protein